jgi:hypothetical protein
LSAATRAAISSALDLAHLLGQLLDGAHQRQADLVGVVLRLGERLVGVLAQVEVVEAADLDRALIDPVEHGVTHVAGARHEMLVRLAQGEERVRLADADEEFRDV